MKTLALPSWVLKLLPEKRTQVWVWVGVVALTGLIALALDFGGSSNAPESLAPESPETASTYIPAGFVLVPIEVANYESLDSILGKFGVVDLYSAPLDPAQRPKKVATKIKILRAPLNPNHFAVLARDQESEKILSFTGPFTVVVQNPKEGGTGFVNGISDESTQPSARTKANEFAKAARTTPKSRITIEVNHADEDSI